MATVSAPVRAYRTSIQLYRCFGMTNGNATNHRFEMESRISIDSLIARQVDLG